MIEAFKLGGDFHTRTALGMYPHIKEAVDRGEVLIEKDTSCPEKAALPVVKDMFASERRKAKTLNFSIAYGKTAVGLAADWGVTTKEAEEILQRWYADRKEVLAWQNRMRSNARTYGEVRTIMQRYRNLDVKGAKKAVKSHLLRAAINTPIQGSAADIVMMAMLKIHSDKRLRELNWRMVLQIHDEVILEGPKETVEEALDIVKRCMREPYDEEGGLPRLSVELDVDAKHADSWYKAK
jgi:DNA polymerase-1